MLLRKNFTKRLYLFKEILIFKFIKERKYFQSFYQSLYIYRENF